MSVINKQRNSQVNLLKVFKRRQEGRRELAKLELLLRRASRHSVEHLRSQK